MDLPRIDIATEPVGVHGAIIRVGNNDRPIGSPHGTPHDVGARVRRYLVINHDRQALGETKVQRAVGQAVVDGVVDAVGARVAARELVDDYPFLDRGDVGYDGHSGTGDVLVVGDVVDGGVPGSEVGGDLVGEFLAVERVALV